MELHAVGRMITVLHRHDLRRISRALTVCAHSRHHEIGWKRIGVYNQRVIANRREWAGDALEQFVVAMHDGTGLAVHEPRRAHDLAAECLTNCLMAQADAEDRHFAGECANEWDQDAGLRGCFWP